MSNQDKELTLLTELLFQGDLAGFESVLVQGANPNEQDSDGRTPLIHATIEDKLDFVKSLVRHNASTTIADNLGMSALHYAAQDYSPGILRYLLDVGAVVDAEDINGNTPLLLAVFNSNGRGEIILSLLAAGANRNHVNKHGQTPLKLASIIANYNVVQFLE